MCKYVCFLKVKIINLGDICRNVVNVFICLRNIVFKYVFGDIWISGYDRLRYLKNLMFFMYGIINKIKRVLK